MSQRVLGTNWGDGVSMNRERGKVVRAWNLGAWLFVAACAAGGREEVPDSSDVASCTGCATRDASHEVGGSNGPDGGGDDVVTTLDAGRDGGARDATSHDAADSGVVDHHDAGSSDTGTGSEAPGIEAGGSDTSMGSEPEMETGVTDSGQDVGEPPDCVPVGGGCIPDGIGTSCCGVSPEEQTLYPSPYDAGIENICYAGTCVVEYLCPAGSILTGCYK
jgi:hypothetical protein